MIFNTDNKIVQQCAKGMMLEGEGKIQQALEIFMHAWDESEDDFEKSIAAHYVARHQESVNRKLEWDKTALHHALKIKDENVRMAYPSLYLNIGKCYEDLNDFDSALENYASGLSLTNHLGEDGYGMMIRNGLLNGINRIKKR